MVAIIPVAVPVPAMIVGQPAAAAFPVPVKKTLSIVMRRNPASPGIRRPAPIPIVPAVTASASIPVTVDPNEVAAWSRWPDADDARGRRWPDPDTDGYLGAQNKASDQQQQNKEFI